MRDAIANYNSNTRLKNAYNTHSDTKTSAFCKKKKKKLGPFTPHERTEG